MQIDIGVVLSSVLTLLMMIAVGFAARKLRIMDDIFSRKLSNLVIVIGQPFMLIGALLKNEYSTELLLQGLIVIVISLAVHILLALGAHFFAKGWKDFDERKILEFSMVFANCAFIGFPILEAAFGEKGLFYGSFYVISFNIFMWSYGMIILGRGRDDIKISPIKMFVNYGTTPCIAGLILYALRIPLPDFFLNGASYIGGICTPISTIVIGGLLATLPLGKIFLSARMYIFCAFKLLVLPLIVTLAAKLVGLTGDLYYLAALMSALPTAANTAMFAEVYDIKPGTAAQAVGMSSVLSVAAIPLVLWLAGLIAAL